jgi:hypothetical protein
MLFRSFQALSRSTEEKEMRRIGGAALLTLGAHRAKGRWWYSGEVVM